MTARKLSLRRSKKEQAGKESGQKRLLFLFVRAAFIFFSRRLHFHGKASIIRRYDWQYQGNAESVPFAFVGFFASGKAIH